MDRIEWEDAIDYWRGGGPVYIGGNVWRGCVALLRWEKRIVGSICSPSLSGRPPERVGEAGNGDVSEIASYLG